MQGVAVASSTKLAADAGAISADAVTRWRGAR